MSKEFEKYAKEAFKSHEVKVDMDALWENVEPHVRPKKDRKGFFWFLLGGLVVASIITGLLFLQIDNNTIAVEDNTLLIPEIIQTETEQKADILKTNPTDVKHKENEHNTKNTKTTKAKNQPALKNKAINNSKTENANNIVNANNNSIAESLDDDKFDLINPLKSNDLIIPQSPTAIVDLANTFEKFLAKPLDFSLLIPYGFVIEEKAKPKDFDFSKIALPPPAKPKMTFGLGLYGGIGRPISTREATDSLDNEYNNARMNSEQQLESIQLGLSIFMKTKQNLTFRTGIEYNRLASRFNAEVTETTFDTIPNSVIEIVINPFTNDTTPKLGEAVNTIRTTFIKETYNYFHLIDIPLLVGYQLDYDNWSFGLEAGIITNLSVKSKGTILRPEYLIRPDAPYYELKEDTENWIKTNLGISPLIHLHLNYRITDQIQIYTSPFFRLKSVFSTEANSLKESYSIFGLQSGAKYSF